MKTVKPDKLSILQRTFEHEGQPRFVLSLLCGFTIDQPRALLSEVEIWKIAADALASENSVIDEGNVKVKGELLVNGKCFVPGGEPAAVSFVRLQFRDIDKRLAVIGDRRWKHGVPTQPEPFVEMPVDWPHAFGGEGFSPNPLGKGVRPIEVDGKKVHPLPNIEDPKHLIDAPSDRPKPVGLGAQDITWPQRFEKVGTHDLKWLETRYPGFAADMDPTLFNAAPEDQHVEGYLRGGEVFVVENMHPERPRIEGQLPDVVPRAFVTHRDPAGAESFREIAMRMDTVRLIPHLEVGIVVFRGVLDVWEDDAADIVHLVAALEAPGQRRTPEHYRHALELRLDKEKGALMVLKNEDLMPPREEGYEPGRYKTEVDEWVQKEDLLAQNLRRKQEKEFEKAKARIVAAGMDPLDFGMDELPPLEPIPDPYDVDAIAELMEREEKLAEERKAELEEKKAAMEQNAREQFAAAGQDYDALVEQALKDNAGPPKFTAAKHLEWMRNMLTIAREGDMPLEELEQQLVDPKFEQEMIELEDDLKRLYWFNAHMQQPFEPCGREGSEMFRAEIEVAHHNDIPLEDRDFSGADLSGLDLAGINLRGAFLEAVNLTGTNLSGANLEGAVLAHATVRETNLTGANLSKANLGGATFDGADLSGCTLTETVLAGAKLSHTTFRGANLKKVSFLDTQFGAEVDLSEVVAEDFQLIRADLRGTRLRGADLTQGVMFEVDARGADWSGINLTKAGVLGCKLDEVRFCEGKLEACQFVYECSLHGADFAHAQMPQAILRGVDLGGARFDHACLDQADLSSSDLSDASLYQARARSALLIRTNLTRANLTGADLLGAILQKAILCGTNLKGANLFSADLAKARADGDTVIENTNMKRTRQIPRAKDGPK